MPAAQAPVVKRQETEAAMLHVVRTFLSCIKSRDTVLMRSLALPHGSACLFRPHRASEAEQPMVMTVKQSIDRVFELTKPEDGADEQSHDELVHLDEGEQFGCVWAPYKFLERGELRHVGSSVFSMVNVEGKWLISGFADVARLLPSE